MNVRPDLELLVTDWLRAVAPPRAPERVLTSALGQVAGIGQEHPIGGRRFHEWIGASPRLRTGSVALVVIIAVLALLGATAVFVGSQRQSDRPSPVVSNGWIAYSTSDREPWTTDITTGSDIYLARAGVKPRLIAGRDGGATRNVCPAFSPDGRGLAFGVASTQGRSIVVLAVDANGVTGETARITVPGSGPAVCPRWSSDGTRVGYLDGGAVVVRGLDGSTPSSVAGDPGVKDLERSCSIERGPGCTGHLWTGPLLSPAGDRIARIEVLSKSCQIVVARSDGTAARVIPVSDCRYSIPAWSPDGRQVLLMEEVGGVDFAMQALSVDSPFDIVTIVSTARANGARSMPGWGDVSWQPVFP